MTQDKLLDFQLKPPYIPPAARLISEAEIEKIAATNIPLSQEIEKSAIKFKGKRTSGGTPNWDKDF